MQVAHDPRTVGPASGGVDAYEVVTDVREPAAAHQETDRAANRLLGDRSVQGALLLLLLAALPIMLPLPQSTKATYSRLYLDVPLLLLVSVVLFRRAVRGEHAHERRFWVLLASAFGFWLVVRGVAILAPGFADGPVGPLLQDATYLGFYVSLLIAGSEQPGAAPPGAVGARAVLLNAAGASVLAFGLLVYFAMVPRLLNPVAYATSAPSLLLYVTLDVFVLVRFVGQALNAPDPSWRRVHRLLVAGALLFVVTDLHEALVALGVLEWVPFGTPLDLAWLSPLVPFAMAARAPVVGAAAEPQEAARPASGWPLLLYPIMLIGLHFTLPLVGFSDPLSRDAREIELIILVGALAVIGVIAQRSLERDFALLAVERQEAERRQEHSRRLEAIGQLAAGIAHDFNNLLGVVSASADLVGAGLTKEQEELRADVQAISDASRRGSSMVGQLVSYAQRRILRPQPSALAVLIEQLLRSARPLLGGKIRVATDFAVGMPPVLADPVAVEQIFLNLLTNARDAMPEGGTIRISTRVVGLTPEAGEPHGLVAGGEFACLAVRDQGHGMDQATLRRAFEPFFTTKALGKGTGLGLATVFGLARQLGGSVAAKSAPGKGTTVEVFLPLASGADPVPGRQPSPSVPPSSRGTETILVVDDDASLRRATRRVLERQGYVVLEAGDGAEALQVFRCNRRTVALIVSDISMPGMSGRDLLDAIRLDSVVPFLLASGFAAVALDLGGTAFIQKPWEVPSFLSAVRNLLDAYPSVPPPGDLPEGSTR